KRIASYSGNIQSSYRRRIRGSKVVLATEELNALQAAVSIRPRRVRVPHVKYREVWVGGGSVNAIES
ncbi:MAG TPA: hypothetical protein VNI77_00110, partial [Nitrososphaera sp.]|nr:hypothetical protein [Nitrososphaera sp.]